MSDYYEDSDSDYEDTYYDVPEIPKRFRILSSHVVEPDCYWDYDVYDSFHDLVSAVALMNWLVAPEQGGGEGFALYDTFEGEFLKV